MASNDTANTAVRPPFLWLGLIVAGLALDWFAPLPFLPKGVPGAPLGGAVFILGFIFAALAIREFLRIGTRVETYKPSTAIAASGPYRLSRNPIYLGMLIGQAGIAIAVDSVWQAAMLIPFALVLRYGVIAREEAYLARKFPDAYGDYVKSVRRWI